jgi:DNA-binding NarL/FixJ family response regulator
MNILIADDEEGFRGLLRDALSSDPTIQISLAANAMEAWWLLGDLDQRFDLGIFDIRMPLVNGFSLLKRIRVCPRYRHLPVIVCSASNDRETITQSDQLAANCFLAKPFKIETLITKVQELGQRRRPSHAFSRTPPGASVSPLLDTITPREMSA